MRSPEKQNSRVEGSGLASKLVKRNGVSVAEGFLAVREILIALTAVTLPLDQRNPEIAPARRRRRLEEKEEWSAATNRPREWRSKEESGEVSTSRNAFRSG